MGFTDVDRLAINTIRILAADATFKSNSGHPGAPMGMAPVAHVLFNKILNFNPKNSSWINRDRFVLSNGHACMLQYALLHLYGYKLSMDDIKAFRSIDSHTPGHPESADTDGVEVTTGPLGQGIANAVGLAIAQHHAADVVKRFEAYGWHVETVADGDNDLESIEAAIKKCQAVKDKPSMIKLRTIIGFGSKQQGTHGVHGSPLKADDIKQLKEKFGFDPEQSFVVPQEVYDICHQRASHGAALEQEWNQLLENYSKHYSSEAADLKRRLTGELPEGWEKNLPTYSPSDDAVASRKLSEIVLQKDPRGYPELVGGSADLTGSNLTRWKEAVDFQAPATGLGDWSGRYIRYGELSLTSFSYAAGAIRLSALSQQRVIWVATHDSIGLGEDGPTHQPIETLAHFRALPNCMVWRPADGNETSAAYYVALTSKNTPSIIALSRQNLPQLENSTIGHAIKGGYVVHDAEKADITLVSTGSEVGICVDAVKYLKEKHNLTARVVSIPCFEVFDAQSDEYRLSVLPDGIPSLFGASGAYKDVYKKFEFTPEGISKRAVATVDFWKSVPNIRSPINRAFKQLI
ncbi:hypothetical protein DID88_003277 [Monilinia fructigena]|uniref:Transketolase-like pyrimidine-binding domain-containing protein n=1 Tax=Monilinia fructigena TaxID=38457 RepID=A0A395J0F7_9HELO|nr:hypothetical protein DID88_003277 [Monilinia fructigena]